jgi:hypothetical protein
MVTRGEHLKIHAALGVGVAYRFKPKS